MVYKSKPSLLRILYLIYLGIWVAYSIYAQVGDLTYDFLVSSHINIQYTCSVLNLLFCGIMLWQKFVKRSGGSLFYPIIGIFVQAIVIFDLIGINRM